MKIQPLKIKFIGFLLLLLLFSGCSSKEISPISKTGFAFDTVVTITLYDSKDTELLDSCFSLCADYEQLFSKTIATSDIGRINTSKGQPVAVSEETAYLLSKAIEYSSLSDGLFDVTIAPVDALWDFNSEAAATNHAVPPSAADISSALTHVNYHNIILSDDTVTLLDPDASIDLGGIAKGYIADRLKKHLVAHGVQSAIIDLGGNILTIGTKPDGSKFHIGIKRPFDPSGDIMTAVDAADNSVVTSGIYERCFTYEDRLYHHILSTATGYPADSDLNSVTIISASSLDCDALSTICLIKGLEDSMALIESIPDTEAVFIAKDDQVYTTLP